MEQNQHWERTYPADNPRFRRVAETAEGQLVGFGECQRPFWSNLKADTCFVYVGVDSAWQHRGIGQTLYAAVTPFAVEQKAVRLRTDCREDSAGTIRFLEKAGFSQIGIHFESALDLQTFDETPFLTTVERFNAAGYTITTLAAARWDDPDADQHLYEVYEVYAEAIVDVPFPGEERIEPTYKNFRDTVLEAPNTDPNAIFIARLGQRMVGMTSLELLLNAIGMTGVLRQHRGRGVALAVKLAAFRYLKAHGYTETRVHNDTANPPILALNAKLGYRRLPGWLVWERAVAQR